MDLVSTNLKQHLKNMQEKELAENFKLVNQDLKRRAMTSQMV